RRDRMARWLPEPVRHRVGHSARFGCRDEEANILMERSTDSLGLTAARVITLGCSCLVMAASSAAAAPQSERLNIFAPESTPAKSIFDLSIFVLAVTGVIFVVVFTLLVYAIVKFRATSANAGREPAQVYGSTQIELAWTIIPVLIVVVLFAATARVIHAVQDARMPATAVEVTAIGHQYWWEFRYPKLG